MPAGEYQCPVLNKVFTEFTHIVAIRTTGNVFSYEVCNWRSMLSLLYPSPSPLILSPSSMLISPLMQAVKELNLKTKNWKELLTDEPFTKDDIITIQVQLWPFVFLGAHIHLVWAGKACFVLMPFILSGSKRALESFFIFLLVTVSLLVARSHRTLDGAHLITIFLLIWPFLLPARSNYCWESYSTVR